MMKPTSYGATSDDERERESRVVAPAPPSRRSSPWTKRRAAMGASLALLGAAATCAYVAMSGHDVEETAPAPHMSMQATAMAESLAASLTLGDSATFESLDVNSDGFVTEGEYLGQLEERKNAVLAKLRESNLPDEFKAPVTEILLDRFTSEATCVKGLFEQSGGDRLDQSSFAFVQPLIRSICGGKKKNAAGQQGESVVDIPDVTTPSVVVATPAEVSDASSGSGSPDEPLPASNNPPPIDNSLLGENDGPVVHQNTQEGQLGETTGSASGQDAPSVVVSTSSSSSSGQATASTETPEPTQEQNSDASSSFAVSPSPSVESTEGSSTEPSADATTAPPTEDPSFPTDGPPPKYEPTEPTTEPVAQSSDESGSAIDTSTMPPTESPSVSTDGSEQNEDPMEPTTSSPSDETTAPATASPSAESSGSEESTTAQGSTAGSTAEEETTASTTTTYSSANSASEEEDESASASGEGATPSAASVASDASSSSSSSSSSSTAKSSPSSNSNAGSLRGASGSSSSPARPGSSSGDITTQTSAPSTSGEGGETTTPAPSTDDDVVATPSPSSTPTGSGEATPTPTSTASTETPQPSLVTEIKEALKDLNLPGEGSSSGTAADPAAVKKFLEELNPANATETNKEKSPERLAFESELTRQFDKLITERAQKLAYASLQVKKSAFMVDLMQECINHAGRRFELDRSFTKDEAVSWITDKCLAFSSMLTHGQH